MAESTDLHNDQIAYWNGRGGEKWVLAQENTDTMLAPVADALVAHVKPAPGTTILDIGCGCGASTMLLAQSVGPEGKIIGLDVSERMLGRARERLSAFKNVELICDDASTHSFEAVADLVISRFGVMFFGDPTAAFANLRRALKPSGRIVFSCWRKFDENPWMSIPLHAAYSGGVPRLPKASPDEPGPFSFADPDRVRRILTGAGFSEPRFTAFDVSLDIAASGGLTAAINQSLTVGATSRALLEQPPELHETARKAISEALSPYVRGNSVPLGGAIWIVESDFR
jgi:SAM-dependent methyltransferase